ncbi:MAG: hypothetical protein ACXWPM_02265 [Bdellovibrionota bacterium]
MKNILVMFAFVFCCQTAAFAEEDQASKPQFTTKEDGTFAVVIRSHVPAEVYPTAMKQAQGYCAKMKKSFSFSRLRRSWVARRSNTRSTSKAISCLKMGRRLLA